MKLQRLLNLLAFIFAFSISANAIDIIPVPQKVQEAKGNFTFKKGTTVSYNTPEAKILAQQLSDRMQELYGVQLTLKEKSGSVQICINPQLNMNDEGYILNVKSNRVEVNAKTAQGAFYGVQSLVQLGKTAQCCYIEDEPRFGYRGFHLDPSRHFITVENVKKQIDLMSMFKINTMHFHLTDDQGWRIEIRKYPKLTQYGSTRIDGEGTEHKGYYTQEEIKDIVKYAQERYITIIPEIDLPGHMMGAICAYPELSCFAKIGTPRIVWGIEDVVLCPGKEMVFGFIEDVLKEVAELFPGKYFHIGGDECPKVEWKTCPSCQQRIKEEGLVKNNEHSPEEFLQSYVINRVEQILAKYDRKIIGWDEILEGGLSPNATVMSWRGESGGIAAALQNHDVIMTSSSNGMYLDAYQGDFRIEPVTIGNGDTCLLAKTYSYDPVPRKVVEAGMEKHILGVQCNNWSEYMYDNEKMEYMMYPRAIALSEIAWSQVIRKDFPDFCRRLDVACGRILDKKGFTYHIPLPEQPNGSCNTIAFTDKANVTFTTSRPVKMVYTLDGSTPNKNSKVYTEPLSFTESANLKIATILPSGKTSKVRNIKIVKQNLQPAQEVSNAKPGLSMKRAEGYFNNISQVNNAKLKWELSEITSLKQMVAATLSDAEMIRGGKGFVTIADGYVDIPEDGVYYLSTNNEELWIDGKLAISNENEVKRYSRNDTSIALAKGLHQIKVVYLANIAGGWPTWWGNGSDVQIRKSNESSFKSITDNQLFHK